MMTYLLGEHDDQKGAEETENPRCECRWKVGVALDSIETSKELNGRH